MASPMLRCKGMWTLIMIWVLLSTLIVGALALVASRPVQPMEEGEFTPTTYKTQQPNQIRVATTASLALHHSVDG